MEEGHLANRPVGQNLGIVNPAELRQQQVDHMLPMPGDNKRNLTTALSERWFGPLSLANERIVDLISQARIILLDDGTCFGWE